MSAYKKFILQNCVVDMILIVAVALSEPIIVINDGNVFIINNGLFRNFSKICDYILILFYIYTIVLSYIVIAIQFVYRYFAFVKNRYLGGFSLAVLFIIPFIINTFRCIACAFLLYPTEEKVLTANEELAKYFHENGSADISVGMVGYSAIGPLVISIIPVMMVIYCIISKADAIVLSSWAGLPLAWIPLVNPVLTIWFVKPYRKALFGRRQTEIIQILPAVSVSTRT